MNLFIHSLRKWLDDEIKAKEQIILAQPAPNLHTHFGMIEEHKALVRVKEKMINIIRSSGDSGAEDYE